MRATALLVATLVTVAAWCQQAPTAKPSVSDLLTKLQSKEWTERSDALHEIRSDPATLRSRKLRDVLIDLLDQENRERDEGSRQAAQVPSFQDATAGRGDDGGEGYGEYYSWLSETVGRFIDWNDPRQVCIMVNAGEIDYPSTPPDAAARARAATPCLLREYKSDPALAVPMLIEALARSGGTLDLETVRTARQVVLNALRGSDVGVRAGTVDALGRFGEADVIPELQEIARSDSASEKRADNGAVWFPIRDAAAKAIAAIQRRQGQQQR